MSRIGGKSKDENMKIDFSEVLMDLDGETPLRIEGDKPLTLRLACVSALLNPRRPISGVQQCDDFDLAERIKESDTTLDLTAEQIVTLKDRIGDVPKPAQCKRAWAILDPATVKKAESSGDAV